MGWVGHRLQATLLLRLLALLVLYLIGAIQNVVHARVTCAVAGGRPGVMTEKLRTARTYMYGPRNTLWQSVLSSSTWRRRSRVVLLATYVARA